MKEMTIDGLLLDGMDENGWHGYVVDENHTVYQILDCNKYDINEDSIPYNNIKKVSNETECDCVIDIIYNTR